ncbi:hypothetical protein B0H15DRAFT_1021712 [Mycena belliarum]|uniref:Uncharacterized protein n=1 Tax=Mycena belliarum TaxID=1033014 RepID=A0AAD6UAR4_9AGAR|nr:hypothetical protein B0H15DRAFT_1021712 [Mycena belliae]
MSNPPGSPNLTPRPTRQRRNTQYDDATPRAPAPASRTRANDSSHPMPALDLTAGSGRPENHVPLVAVPADLDPLDEIMAIDANPTKKGKTSEPKRTNLRSETPWLHYEHKLPSFEDKAIPLVDYICIPPPHIPPIYSDSKLSSTRDLPKAKTLDTSIKEEDHLLSVVCVTKMMNSLMSHVREKHIDKFKLDPNRTDHRDWMVTTHPTVTSRSLPAVIQSESDTEDWVLDVIWRPALAGYWAAVNQSVAPQKCSPNLTSCAGGGKGAVLPDVMVWDSKRELKATVEIKTHGAFISHGHDSVGKSKGKSKAATFDHINHHWPEKPEGYGIRFNWPELGDTSAGTTKADKMIVQVWLQMVDKKVNYAALTNYESVIFFVRQGQTLYMSGEYTRETNMSLAIFAFIAYVMDGIRDKTLLKLPAKIEWWEQNEYRAYGVGTGEAPGLDPTTLPARLERIQRLMTT